MKKVVCFVSAFLLIFSICAQEQASEENSEQKEEKKFYILFDEGFSYSKITRIVKQQEKSNYVFEDYLVGAFLTAHTEYFWPFNPLMRISAYVPFSTEFNNTEQARKRFGWLVDGFLGVEFKGSIQGWVNSRFGPGLHFNYEYADRFDYMSVGVAGYINVELPVSYNWTVLLDGVGSYDFLGNLGTNKYVEYYDHVWQWQTGVGIRYSSKGHNVKNYCGQTAEQVEARKAAKQAKKDAKKALLEAKKLEREELKKAKEIQQ